MTNYDNDPGARFYEEHMDDFASPQTKRTYTKKRTYAKKSAPRYSKVKLTPQECTYLINKLSPCRSKTCETLIRKLRRYG